MLCGVPSYPICDHRGGTWVVFEWSLSGLWVVFGWSLRPLFEHESFSYFNENDNENLDNNVELDVNLCSLQSQNVTRGQAER